MKNRTRRQEDHVRTNEFLALNPVFSLEELASYLGVTPAQARFRATYYQQQKQVKRVANTVYAVVPPGSQGEGFAPDPYVAAAVIRPDAVFAFHSALDLQGQGHSVWWACTVCTAERRPPLKVGRTTIKFLAHPPALRAKVGQTAVGGRWTVVVHRGGRPLRVTNPERTLVEGFKNLSLVGGLDELVESADGFATLQHHELADVLDAYGNRRLWGAVGWYLARRQADLSVPPSVLDKFKTHRPRATVYLVPGQRGGVMDKTWNLVVPAHLERRPEGDPDGP